MGTYKGNTVGPSYGVQARVNEASSTTDTTLVVIYDPQWWIHWQVAYSSGFRGYGGYDAGSGDVWTWDTGAQGCSGGSTGSEWTFYAGANRSVAFPRKPSAYTAKVFAHTSSPWGESDIHVPYTVPALAKPGAPSGCSHTRDSDSQNTVAWENGSGARTATVIERSVSGSGFSQVASAAAAATSWADGDTQAGFTYSYRVKARFSANGYDMESAYSAASAATANTPRPPASCAAARTGANTVTVSWDYGQGGTAGTDTGVEWRRSTDALSWGDPVAVAGEGLTSATDSPGGGTFYYQVRATRGGLKSAWSPASNAVVTITPPAAPTLTSPQAGASLDMSKAQAAFQWRHNPLDGSAQSAWQAQVSKDGGATWQQLGQGTGAQEQLAVAMAALSQLSGGVNATALWRVRTKGAHADYSQWPTPSAFTLRQAPQAFFTSPAADGDSIDALPLAVAWSYADSSGSQAEAALALRNASGSLLWERRVAGAQASYQLAASEFFPANNSGFTLRATLRSTSGLTAQAVRTFKTAYAEPAAPEGTADVDPRRASVSLCVMAGADEGKPPAVSFSVVRRHASGRQVPLLEQAAPGTAIDDPFCPVEQDVVYAFIAHAATGAAAVREVPVRIRGRMACWVNFGGRVLGILLDSSYSHATDIPSEAFSTPGGGWPIAYFGTSKRRTGTVAGTVMRLSPPGSPLAGYRAGIDAVDELSEHTGMAVLRLPGKDAFPVMVSQVSQSHEGWDCVGVSLTWEQVRDDGAAL
jgi:hypothetical protein